MKEKTLTRLSLIVVLFSIAHGQKDYKLLSAVSETSSLNYPKPSSLNEIKIKCINYLNTTLSGFLNKVVRPSNKDGSSTTSQTVEVVMNKKVNDLMGECNATSIGTSQFVLTKIEPRERSLSVEQLVIQKIEVTPNVRKLNADDATKKCHAEIELIRSEKTLIEIKLMKTEEELQNLKNQSGNKNVAARGGFDGDSCEDKLRGTEKLCEEWMGDLKNTRIRLMEAEKTLKIQKNETDLIKKKLLETEEELQNLKRESQNNISDLKKINENLNGKNIKLEQNLAILTNESEILRIEKQRLINNELELKEKLSSMAKEIAAMKKENEAYKENKMKDNDQKKILLDHLTNLVDEVQSLKNNSLFLVNVSLKMENKLNMNQKTIYECTESHKGNLSLLNETKDSLLKANSNIASCKKEIDYRLSIEISLNEEKRNAESKASKLAEDKKNQQDELKQLKQVIEILNTNVSFHLEAENLCKKNLNVEISNVVSSNKDAEKCKEEKIKAESQVTNLGAEKTKLQVDVNHLKKFIESLTANITLLSDYEKNCTINLEKANSTITLFKGDYEECKESKDKIRKECDQIKTENSEKTELIKRLSDEKINLIHVIAKKIYLERQLDSIILRFGGDPVEQMVKEAPFAGEVNKIVGFWEKSHALCSGPIATISPPVFHKFRH